MLSDKSSGDGGGCWGKTCPGLARARLMWIERKMQFGRRNPVLKQAPTSPLANNLCWCCHVR